MRKYRGSAEDDGFVEDLKAEISPGYSYMNPQQPSEHENEG